MNIINEVYHHKINLNRVPFKMVLDGNKTIELRLFDEKRQKINIGDTISLVNDDSGEILEKRVADLIIKPTFEEIFYNDYKKVDAGYSKETDDVDLDMSKYYSKKDLNKYGVVGIILY